MRKALSVIPLLFFARAPTPHSHYGNRNPVATPVGSQTLSIHSTLLAIGTLEGELQSPVSY
jgi:hypothetical protein